MPKNTHVLGIDIGGTCIKSAYFPKVSSKIHSWKSVPTAANKLALWQSLINLINWYKKTYKINSIGIGCPGPLNIKHGTILATPHLPWKNFPLRTKLEQATKLKIYLDNDANAFTLAEGLLGAGKNYHNIVAITLGTGVGGGILINKQIYHGRNNAGELGYLLIERGGKRGPLGERGAWQEYLKASALLKKAEGLGLKIKNTKELAKKHNNKTQTIWNNFGKTIGWGLASITNILDPDIIIIGGQISKAWPRFILSLKKELKISTILTPPKIVKAKLGDKAGVIGAALLTQIPHARTKY